MTIPLLVITPQESRGRDGIVYPVTIGDVSVVSGAFRFGGSGSMLCARVGPTSRIGFMLIGVDKLAGV